ncbi:helix-turn-helix domain-containing protein [Oleidesulfovibrio alaskensis]|uniref:helix-turn-helix domain-containing protein n=1 Tax=Oleidesulfovibrio alaskensis TaxID=58180 RepID=UPI000419469D|nr:helix-turn-helix domain-containing protein [Oleidesulfovibrio alaskensis]
MTESPPIYDCQPQADFDSQFARIFEVAECRTQLELAEFLNIKQSSVSDAKRRQTVPSEWLVKLFEKKRINPEWLRTGIGGKFVHMASDEEIKKP